MTRAKRKSTTIDRLYKQFEAAHAEMAAVPPGEFGDKKNEAIFNRAVLKWDRIGNKIIATPAESLGDMLAKIKVAGSLCGRKFEELDHWKPGRMETERALVSLRKDIHQIAKLGLTDIGRSAQ
jgi:hypothetical protein